MPSVPKRQPNRHYVVVIPPKISFLHGSLHQPWILNIRPTIPNSTTISISER